MYIHVYVCANLRPCSNSRVDLGLNLVNAIFGPASISNSLNVVALEYAPQRPLTDGVVKQGKSS